MPGNGGKRTRALTAVIAAAGVACGAAYGAADDPPEVVPVVPGDDGTVRVDSSRGEDAADDVADAGSDVGELLPGTDGAADDGAPISADAGFDASLPPGCTSPGMAACERVVFVSGSTVTFSEVANADAICTALAAEPAALPRIGGRLFQAWVSNGATVDPASRFVHGTGRYIRPDGTVIAQSWTDLTDGTLQRSIFHDQTGKSLGPSYVWTATSSTGTFSGPNCTAWTNVADTARTGVVGATSASWTSFSQLQSCGTPARVYCFEK